MAFYSDYALAAYQDRLAAEAAATREGLVQAAYAAARPLVADPKDPAKVLFDLTKVPPAFVDEAARMVVLFVNDGSNIYFAVWPDTQTHEAPAHMEITQQVDGAWVHGPTVADLDDVGEALSGGAA